MTSLQKERIEFIDFAKGFAVLTIVLYHFLDQLNPDPPLSSLIRFGGTGIHLFFFLSGYGLGKSSYSNANAFYRRRFLKILLPYYLLVLIAFLLSRFLPIYQEFGFRELLSHFLLYKMFVEEYSGSYGYHLWFISPLVQIYLIYPLLRGAQRLLRPGIFLLMGGLLSVGYWILIWSLDKGSLRIWNSFFLAYLWEFVLGMYLAKHPFSLTWMKRNHWEYGIVAILGTAIMAGVVLYFGEAGRLFNDIPALLGYTAICLLTFRISEKYFSWFKNVFLQLGKASYAFFLVHMLVLLLYREGLELFGFRYTIAQVPLLLLLCYFAALGFQKMSAKLVDMA